MATENEEVLTHIKNNAPQKINDDDKGVEPYPEHVEEDEAESTTAGQPPI